MYELDEFRSEEQSVKPWRLQGGVARALCAAAVRGCVVTAVVCGWVAISNWLPDAVTWAGAALSVARVMWSWL